VPVSYAYLQGDYLQPEQKHGLLVSAYTALIAAFAARSAVIHAESAVTSCSEVHQHGLPSPHLKQVLAHVRKFSECIGRKEK
jgi:hypothetical protein